MNSPRELYICINEYFDQIWLIVITIPLAHCVIVQSYYIESSLDNSMMTHFVYLVSNHWSDLITHSVSTEKSPCEYYTSSCEYSMSAMNTLRVLCEWPVCTLRVV